MAYYCDICEFATEEGCTAGDDDYCPIPTEEEIERVDPCPICGRDCDGHWQCPGCGYVLVREASYSRMPAWASGYDDHPMAHGRTDAAW